MRDGWFDSDSIVGFSLVSAVAMIWMLYRELTIKNPVIDLYAFRNINFAFGCIFSFVIGLGLYVMVYLIHLEMKSRDSPPKSLPR